MRDVVSDHAGAAAAKASYAVGGLGVVGGMTFQDWLSVLGAVVMVATFVVNWYYKRRHLDLAEREHQRREQERCETDDAT